MRPGKSLTVKPTTAKGIWLNDVLVDGVKEDVKLDDYDFDDLLSSIYDNEIFVLFPSDYGITIGP